MTVASYGVLSAQVAITKCHRLGGLDNRLIFSQCWWLEVQDQGTRGLLLLGL